MALDPEDIQALAQAVAALLERPVEPVVLTEAEADALTQAMEAARAEREREEAAAAEAERWANMPADELAKAESAARIQRWVDARDDLNERKAPLDLLADLEAGMSPQEIAAAKARP